MQVRIQSKNGFKIINSNRRRAIRERCYNCAGYNWAEVARCQMKDCQLYPYRNGKGKQDAKARSKAIRDYCLWCMNGQLFEVSRCDDKLCPLFPYRKTNTDMSANVDLFPENDRIRVSEAA